MSTTRPNTGSLILIGVVLAILLVGGLYVREHMFPRKVSPVQSSSTTAPATQPATQPAAADLPPRTYMDLIRKSYPKYPTTQPLDQSLGVAYMGRFVLPHRAFLDRSLRLWVTHSEAPTTEDLFAGSEYSQVVLTRERPVYVHWMLPHEDNLLPHLVVLNARHDGFDLLSRKGREPIGEGTDYDWHRAFSWDEAIVVPRSNRVSVFFFASGRPSESPSPVLVEGTDHAPVEIAFANGPLAWVPPTEKHPGSTGAVRCIENAWFTLKAQDGWGAGMLHLVPLLDGSILQVLLSFEDPTVKLNIVPLDPMGPDEEKKIALLIVQLSDPDADNRDKAYEQLTRYGPGLWSVAERMIDGEPPETQARLKDLLRSRINPLLGGMQLVGQKLRVVSRYPDGGALFFSDNGVVIPQGQQEPLIIKPAWLSVRPGTRIQLLPQELTKDLDPGAHRLTPWSAEWVVSDDTRGPRRFLGGELVPLLRKSERQYSRFAGIASGGRWIFKRERHREAPTSGSTTAPALADFDEEDSVLIIDPRLSDPRPRLPVWQLTYEKGEVGWDKNNWPATKSGGAWALGARDWRPIDEAKEPFFTKASDVPAPPPPPQGSARRPTTATTAPAATQPLVDDTLLLVDSEGNYYFDGTTTLRVLKPNGSLIEWSLPSAAAGEAPTFLVRAQDGALFLFNQVGRVHRLRWSDDPTEPFTFEATFTRNIPEVKSPARIWVDPFDRIIIAKGTTLTILFPKGYVPSSMSNLMTAQDENAILEDD